MITLIYIIGFIAACLLLQIVEKPTGKLGLALPNDWGEVIFVGIFALVWPLLILALLIEFVQFMKNEHFVDRKKKYYNKLREM